jgi:hypothetical protein
MVAMKLTPWSSTTFFKRFHPWQGALDAQLHQVVGQQAAPTATAKGAFMDGLRRHVMEMVGDRGDDPAGNHELPTGHVAHSRGTCHVAGVMECDDPVVVGFFVEAEGATLDQVISHFADVLRYRVAWIKVVKRADAISVFQKL